MTPRRLVAAALAILPWLVAPGYLQPDTKTDFTISPWRYLGRSLNAWNGHAGLGELQNQAYGYLFPYGPLMAVLHSLGIPAWAAQRAWWSLILVVSFLGAAALMRRLRIAAEPAVLVAAVAYALAPRVVSVLAHISVEAWPGALAPWLVVAAVPLVNADLGRRAMLRQAAITGLLAASLGGVNATASAVALLPALLWLLTADRFRFSRLAVWTAAVAAGAAWWLLPLFVLGGYAYPFLDYIETARLTTAVTSLSNVLRGASHWIGYLLDSQSHPVWQAGWVQAQYVTAIVSGCVVAGLSLAGLLQLARRTGGSHVARWALTSVLAGLFMMSLGYAASVGSPLAGPVRDFLDGPGAALRNVHKADPVLRLPLALGLATVLAGLRSRVVLAAALAAVLVSPTAFWVGRVGDPGEYRALPADWKHVAAAVDTDARAHGGSTLVLPSARTATFTWGTLTDEPLSALASSPVVARAAAPLGIGAATRILDTADLLASSGERQPTLAGGLARMGIARVVVRHDVAASVQAEPARQVERTLARSAGFTRIARFGELSLWSVAGTAGPLTTYPAGSREQVRGGPESVFDLAPDAASWLAVQPAAQSPSVVIDSLRWRAYNNGRPAQNAYSPTLPESDLTPTRIGARDLPPAGDRRLQPTREVVGAARVTASSSAADPFARSYVGPGSGWAAAIDGDLSTAWLSDSGSGASYTIGFAHPTTPGLVRVRLAEGVQVWTPSTIRINGREVAVVHDVAQLTIESPLRSVRVELPGPGGGSGGDVVVGMKELRLNDAPVSSLIRLPGSVDPRRTTVVLRRDPRAAPGRQGEDATDLVRALTWSHDGRIRVSVTTRGKPTGGRIRIGAQTLSAGGGTIEASAGPAVVRATCGDGCTVQSLRLSPAGQRAVVALTGRSVSVTASGAGEVAAKVGPGGDSVVALTQGANRGWTATAGGRRLQPVTVDGWRQGFRLPASGATSINVTFAPTRWHRIGLGIGAALAVALLALLLLTWSAVIPKWVPGVSQGRPKLGRTGLGRPSLGRPALAVGAALGVGFLLAGGWGILVSAAVLAMPRSWAAQAAFATMTAAGVALAGFGVVDQQSIGATAGQLLALAAVTLLARELIAAGPEPSQVAPTSTPTPSPPVR